MQKCSQPIKIVFFDIDETLYIKAEKRIPDSIFEQVIPRLTAKGIIPAIATGRCVGAFPLALAPLLREKGIELLVTINGQHNSYQGQVISHYPLDVARIEKAIMVLNDLGVVYACVGNEEIAVSADNPFVQQALLTIKSDYVVEPDFYRHQPVYQLLAFFTSSEEPRIINSGVLGEDLKMVRWHNNAVDLLSRHNSKALGIQDVLTHLGLTLDNAMAFGDGLNDLEMLMTVGLGVAMGNGEAELKAVADFVTLPIEQDGILFALEHFGVI